ncbi:hypothetical protein B0H19DRAFT_1144872 [Mycena capillaripes]|nr:hypothetical protein B0H19DRAFT_1144872 [Mycena capillaripes]
MPQNLEVSTSHSAHALPRGKACMTCRRRKIKCDGHRPKCSQCRRSPGTDECHYALGARKGKQQLEETTNKVQLRIRTLEESANDGDFHRPCHKGDGLFMAKEVPQFNDSWTVPGSVGLSASPSRPTPSFLSDSSSPGLEAPPSEVAERLVDSFLENFSQAQVGFFLDVAAFRHSALLAAPLNSYDRPLPTLMSAVYMWGSRFSQAPRHPVYNEDAFLACTLQNIHQDLACNHPRRVMQALQTEILLSFYYLTLGQPVEGIYHCSAAVSLALSAGLHLIESSHITLQPCFSGLETALLPRRSALEDSERTSAFWTVVILNNYWAVAYGSPSMIPYGDTPVDTPWPLELDDYITSGLFDSDTTVDEDGTVSKFLSGLLADRFSALALHSKASILLERALTFSGKYADDPDDAAFDSLDVLLDQFMSSLPEPRCIEKSTRRLLVTQTLTHAAIIRLHAHRIHTSDESRRKYLTAALTVVHIITSTDFSRWRGVDIDPIMAILWATVCDVFLGALADMDAGGAVALSERYQDLTSCLETVLSIMRLFARSPFIEHFCARVEEAYANTLLEN